MPRVRRPVRFRQLSEFDRGRIVGLREAGLSFRAIAVRVQRSVDTVVRCCQAWFREGRTQRARGTGRRRRTTDREDRRLRLLALRDRFSTTRSIANEWFAEHGRPIGMRSVYRRMRSFGLFSYRPHWVLPLTREHRRNRLEWCRQRSPWDQEWISIVFSDESRFCLGMHDGRARVRRRRGERRNPQFFVEMFITHHTVRVMVWRAIAYGSRSPLIFIRGNMNAQRYIHEVLEPHLLPYLDTLADPTFQQDNARPHVARVTIDVFQHKDVTLLPWPPRSPDLSPIEHVWDMMGRRLLNLQRPPQTLEALREELVVAWNEIPHEDIDHLIRSMSRRVGECVAHQGASKHY
ncbi:unnamed protein product [Acanthoscelides obtectus]|uniref:Transposase n=1 Tax=Acanthoscelides obtectus TaxID=200917 RepID=A0A9P0PUM0_ACAOB|nr:unnamed protein product [Acanthoscelides obtectus]CAK1649774.1 Transposable element Tc3 transposase [Acanthoscelides obtectus]